MLDMAKVPLRDDPRYEVYQCGSDITTEVETLELIYGFVRTFKPLIVIETGCNVGIGTAVIEKALIDNRSSSLFYTCDTDYDCVKFTQRTTATSLTGNCYTPNTVVVYCDGVDLIQNCLVAHGGRKLEPWLFFLDSSFASRCSELEIIRGAGLSNALVLVHDIWLDSALLQKLKSFLQYSLIKGPRGLGVITI